MDNINKAPGGTPVRHKLKKVKRPIKRPVSTPETLSVPPKTTEFAAPASGSKHCSGHDFLRRGGGTSGARAGKNGRFQPGRLS